jgi:hypothetical protein
MRIAGTLLKHLTTTQSEKIIVKVQKLSALGNQQPSFLTEEGSQTMYIAMLYVLVLKGNKNV